MSGKQRPGWLVGVWVFLFPVVGMALGVGVTVLLRSEQASSSLLVVNLFFLAACLAVLPAAKMSRQDLGLRILPRALRWHVFIALIITILYGLYYLFVIRISGLKPFSSDTIWGLASMLAVAFTEELYFRGLLYGYIERGASSRAALVITSLLFGLFHARQGITGIISKTATGWLWGSVRASSGMIFLLIIPVHFLYNSIWLIFEGNWDNPPGWVIYAVPVLEFLVGLAIVLMRSSRAVEEQSP